MSVMGNTAKIRHRRRRNQLPRGERISRKRLRRARVIDRISSSIDAQQRAWAPLLDAMRCLVVGPRRLTAEEVRAAYG
jgi:hypothetical protein